MIILTLILIGFLASMAFHVCGFFLGALLWLVVKLPVAIILASLGLVCCVTIILIPLGMGLFKASWGVLV